MIDTAPFSLIVNAVAAPLSLAFLIILLWNDLRGEINQFLGLFLVFVIVWNASALFVQAAVLAEIPVEITRIARIALDLGFTGASISAFALTAVVVKAYTRRLRGIAFVAVLTLLVYRLALLLSTDIPQPNDVAINYRAQPLLVIFLIVFGSGTLLLMWRNRRSLRSSMLTIGLLSFVFAELFGFVNPELGLWVVANNLGAFAAMLISFALVKQEIIRPLAERTSQVEVFRTVTVALVNQESLSVQFDQIARHAAAMLKADGVGIFVTNGLELRLACAWQLPARENQTFTAVSGGIAGTSFSTRRTLHLDNYSREWRGQDDFPFSRETFGSVICTPIIHGDDILGVLMVVSARQGRLFRPEDIYMLEMMATQIAVAVIYHRLFDHQKELDRLKNEMLRMASHDLKNPLQASMANLDLVRDDLASYPDEDVQDSLSVIDKQLRRMSRIIRGVLDLERLREGKPHLEPFSVYDLITRVADELSEQARDNHVALGTEDDLESKALFIVCDAGQLERALVNIAENAIKFTPAGGSVFIGAKPDANTVVFRISDTGVGIAEAHKPFVFDRFYRASPRGMEHVNGSGLGLSLVKAIVENHHGEVWFTSTEGVGTTFFVAIPASRREVEENLPPLVPASAVH